VRLVVIERVDPRTGVPDGGFISSLCESVVNYTERLRRLALNDPSLLDGRTAGELGSVELEPRTLALVQLAALIAVGGAVPSYGELADAAVGSGVTTAQVVDVLVAVIPIVGLPCVVDAAPKLRRCLQRSGGSALSLDLDAALAGHQTLRWRRRSLR
jgi:hypothetical protein